MALNQYTEITFAARRVRGQIIDRILAILADDFAVLLSSLLLNSSTRLRTEDAATLSAAFLAGLRDYGDDFVELVTAGAARTSTLAAQSHANALASTAGPAFAAATTFDDIPFRALEGMVARRGLAQRLGVDGFSGLFRTLIDRNITQLAGAVDQYLEFAVATGITQQQTTVGLAVILSETDPALAAAVSKIGPRGGLRKGIVAAELPTKVRNRLNAARAMMRRANLIAVHEINSAYDEADKLASVRSPVVGVLRWRVSGRHDGLKSSPDICDVAQETDNYGLGPGRYPPSRAPSLQHPRCQCWTEKELRPRKEWRQPKPEPPDLTPPSLDQVRTILDRDTGGEATLTRFVDHLENAERAA